MTTELTEQIIVPYSGEVVSLSADTEVLAALVDEVRDVESRLRELKAAISVEVHARFDRERKWSIVAGGFRVEGQSDQPIVEYDADRLNAVLTQLVEDGEITRDAADEAVESEVVLKVKKRGVNALRKSPRFRQLIDACATERPPEGRRLKVTRI